MNECDKHDELLRQFCLLSLADGVDASEISGEFYYPRTRADSEESETDDGGEEIVFFDDTAVESALAHISNCDQCLNDLEGYRQQLRQARLLAIAGGRYVRNFHRILTVLEIPQELLALGNQTKSTEYISELLRVVVVFTHATVEDYFREVLRIYLHNIDAETLKTIPLIGTSSPRFHLGDLAKYQGMAADEIIRQSVDDYVDHISASSTSIIASNLEKVGIDPSPLKPTFPALQEMIDRRHRIVHRFDLSSDRDSGDLLESTNVNELRMWLLNTNGFFTTLADMVLPIQSAKLKAIHDLMLKVPTLRYYWLIFTLAQSIALDATSQLSALIIELDKHNLIELDLGLLFRIEDEQSKQTSLESRRRFREKLRARAGTDLSLLTNEEYLRLAAGTKLE